MARSDVVTAGASLVGFQRMDRPEAASATGNRIAWQRFVAIARRG